jgi:hypothetical protein
MEELLKSLKKLQINLKVPKSQRNNFGKYNYRSCEDILEEVKKVLDKENDCTLFLQDELVMLGGRFYVKATAIYTNGKENISVSAYAREEEEKKGMDGSQITGSASSYARKYALNGLLLIDDTKDSDYTNTGQKTQPSVLQKTQEKTKIQLNEKQWAKTIEAIMSGEKTIEQVIAACELTAKQTAELEFLTKSEPSEEERYYNDLN